MECKKLKWMSDICKLIDQNGMRKKYQSETSK